MHVNAPAIAGCLGRMDGWAGAGLGWVDGAPIDGAVVMAAADATALIAERWSGMGWMGERRAGGGGASIGRWVH